MQNDEITNKTPLRILPALLFFALIIHLFMVVYIAIQQVNMWLVFLCMFSWVMFFSFVYESERNCWAS